MTVYGVVCQRWKPLFQDARCEVEIVLKANYIEVNNDQSSAALVLEDVQKEFEEFWGKHKHDPIAGRTVYTQGTHKHNFSTSRVFDMGKTMTLLVFPSVLCPFFFVTIHF